MSMKVTSLDHISDLITNKGLSIVIVVFFMFLGYKYFDMKLTHFQHDFEHKLMMKGYSLRGSIEHDTVGSTIIYDAKLEVIEDVQ